MQNAKLLENLRFSVASIMGFEEGVHSILIFPTARTLKGLDLALFFSSISDPVALCAELEVIGK